MPSAVFRPPSRCSTADDRIAVRGQRKVPPQCVPARFSFLRQPYSRRTRVYDAYPASGFGTRSSCRARQLLIFDAAALA